MPTRNIVLTDHQSRLLEQLVTSGRYQNASEVLREGLRLVERRENEDELRLTRLREAVNVGLVDMELGAFKHFDSDDELGQHLQALAHEVIAAQ
jgi:antitoxin ParD1/3/4